MALQMIIPAVARLVAPLARTVGQEILEQGLKKGGKEILEQGLKKGGKEILEQGGEKIIKEGGQKALKEFLDLSKDTLFKGATEPLREALEKAFTKGGGAFLREGLNFLDKGLGNQVEDALSVLTKSGKFTDLADDQLKALGKGLLQVAGLLI